jgi:hypothetical protein
MLCTDGWGRLEGAFAAASSRIWIGAGRRSTCQRVRGWE